MRTVADHCGTTGIHGALATDTTHHPGAIVTTPENEDLKARAKDYVEHLPAETALGNADPAGGSTDDPELYDENPPSKTEQ
jgi:hypothetical protein